MRDRSKWKTLRDFVDEHAVNDLLESLEGDRNILDVCIIITVSLIQKLYWGTGHSLPNL